MFYALSNLRDEIFTLENNQPIGKYNREIFILQGLYVYYLHKGIDFHIKVIFFLTGK